MVKRVFRGNKDLGGMLVMVEGLGNPNFCVSRPRLHDTRVFFVNNMKTKEFRFGSPTIEHFRLRSSLLRPTAQNIKTLSKLANQFQDKGKKNCFHIIHLFNKFINK